MQRAWRKLANRFGELVGDENGAALIEYTVLLAILLVAVIVIIAGVGTWISGRWSALSTALP